MSGRRDLEEFFQAEQQMVGEQGDREEAPLRARAPQSHSGAGHSFMLLQTPLEFHFSCYHTYDNNFYSEREREERRREGPCQKYMYLIRREYFTY